MLPERVIPALLTAACTQAWLNSNAWAFLLALEYCGAPVRIRGSWLGSGVSGDATSQAYGGIKRAALKLSYLFSMCASCVNIASSSCAVKAGELAVTAMLHCKLTRSALKASSFA